MKEKKDKVDLEPPTELEMRNRHVRTTETMIRNWVMYTKLLIQRLGRPQTHKLVDMTADQANLEVDKDGNIVQNPVTEAERDYEEVENKIVDMVIPEDDKLTHGTKNFFKPETYSECSTDGCNREAEHILEAQSSENEEKMVERDMCSPCKTAFLKNSMMSDTREMRFYPINE